MLAFVVSVVSEVVVLFVVAAAVLVSLVMMLLLAAVATVVPALAAALRSSAFFLLFASRRAWFARRDTKRPVATETREETSSDTFEVGFCSFITFFTLERGTGREGTPLMLR